MKAAYQFTAEPRATTGTGSARALRRENRVPAVIYGTQGKEPTHCSVPLKDLELAYLKGSFQNKIVQITLGGENFFALPKEVQLHPVTDRPEHADFVRVDANSAVKVKVPVKFLNIERSVGIKRGGVLNIVRHDIEFLCRPDAIPTAIAIDIVNSNIGDSIHINDVKLPEGVKPLLKRNFTIATVAGRSTADEAQATDAAAPAAAPAADAKAAAAPAKAAPAKDKK